jgi:hypothetical protein
VADLGRKPESNSRQETEEGVPVDKRESATAVDEPDIPHLAEHFWFVYRQVCQTIDPANPRVSMLPQWENVSWKEKEAIAAGVEEVLRRA